MPPFKPAQFPRRDTDRSDQVNGRVCLSTRTNTESTVIPQLPTHTNSITRQWLETVVSISRISYPATFGTIVTLYDSRPSRPLASTKPFDIFWRPSSRQGRTTHSRTLSFLYMPIYLSFQLTVNDRFFRPLKYPQQQTGYFHFIKSHHNKLQPFTFRLYDWSVVCPEYDRPRTQLNNSVQAARVGNYETDRVNFYRTILGRSFHATILFWSSAHQLGYEPATALFLRNCPQQTSFYDGHQIVWRSCCCRETNYVCATKIKRNGMAIP